MVNQRYFLAAALTGCALAASAYAIRHYSRHREALQNKDDLRTWEGEGGKPAPSTSTQRPARDS